VWRTFSNIIISMYYSKPVPFSTDCRDWGSCANNAPSSANNNKIFLRHQYLKYHLVTTFVIIFSTKSFRIKRQSMLLAGSHCFTPIKTRFIELYRITDFTTKNTDLKAVISYVFTFAGIHFCHNLTRSIRSNIFASIQILFHW
jgi:hypothetical protein